jgi:putative hemolysin
MNPTDLLLWIGWVLCLILSFALSGMEAGLFALNTLRVRRQARAGVAAARRLLRYLDNSEQFLWTLFVGNTLANFLVLVWVLVRLEGWLGTRPFWLWAAYALAVFDFYILCDLLPKTLFRAFPHRTCMALAGPIRLIELALRPLVWVLQRGVATVVGWEQGPVFRGGLFRSRDELRAVMQDSASGFTSEERQYINRVLDLNAMSVRQLMKPMQLVVTVTMDSRLSEVLELCRREGFTRFPVWDVHDGQRRIAGILDLDTVVYRDDLESEQSIARFVKPAVFLQDNLPVEKALRRMRHTGQSLAVVMGRNNQEIGLLALQDVLKRIFGEVAF